MIVATGGQSFPNSREEGQRFERGMRKECARKNVTGRMRVRCEPTRRQQDTVKYGERGLDEEGEEEGRMKVALGFSSLAGSKSRLRVVPIR